MIQIVADSSSIILLAKCSLLKIFCEFFDVLVPTVVSSEVASKELAKIYPDAASIAELISKKAIIVNNPGRDRPAWPISLHKGEEDALRLAFKMDRPLIASDDGKAIKAARFLNVPFIVSPKIVVELFKYQKISFQKARKAIEKLDKIGRYSPEIIAEALISLMEQKNGKADNNKDF